MDLRWLCLTALSACVGEAPISELGVNEIAIGPSGGGYIEVMNATDEPRSLEGWRVEQDEEDLVLGDLVVEAGGFAMIGDLALAEGGGTLDLVDPDGEVVDSVDFPAIDPGQGFGRVPDAAPNWQRIDEPTPGGPNR